jgi:hypothetical protein
MPLADVPPQQFPPFPYVFSITGGGPQRQPIPRWQPR